MTEHEINKLDNMIMGWYLDPKFCDKIIEYHKQMDSWGEVVDGAMRFGVDKKVKNSRDCYLRGDIREEYCQYIQPCADAYAEKYPYSNFYDPWDIFEDINVQKYDPNGGFYGWHTERSSTAEPSGDRHLVFMTYLNDVNDAGETEFAMQNIKVKPEKGLTLIWGAEWMFTHRGIPSPTETKYIATGWYSYVPVSK